MTKTKILIVEDERITAEAIQTTLEFLGYPVSSIVPSGEEAVKEAKKEKPDLVLMDIKLKGEIDGIEAARQIRSLSDIPIIYITALTNKATLERAKKTAPYGYIHKPIEEKDLFSTIEMALLRRDLELELKESEQYREVVEKARIGILIDDIEGTILYSNEKAAELFGYSIKEIKKQSIKSLVHPDDIKMVAKFHKDCVQGKSVSSRYVFRGIRKDGSIRYLELDAVIHKKGDEVIGTRLYMRDITERKKAEEEKDMLHQQLAHSVKMAGIGTLAGGIAHEFNNILQIIEGHVEFAQRTKKQEDIDEALNIVTSYAQKAAKIIKDLLTFSSVDESTRKKRVNIDELIDSVLLLTEEHFKKRNIEIVRKFQKAPQMEVNKGEMQQMFLNLITNARDAMFPKGGKLKIETKRNRNRVNISFTDTGVGIKKENLSRIFEPFYTTKGAIGKGDIPGTGLGLSVSYGIVKRHGGTIDAKSQEGKGTTFTVTMPVAKIKPKKVIVEK